MNIFITLLSILCWASLTLAAPLASWYDLMEYDYETNTLSLPLQTLLQKPVKVVGFIVPLIDEINFDSITEFYLVPDPMMCIHVPPPPPNQMLHVKMAKPIPLDIDFEGVWIEGFLKPIKNANDEEPGYILEGSKAWACNDYPFDEFLEPIDILDYLD